MEGRRHHAVDERAPERRAPVVAPAPPPRRGAARVLALQAGAGNAAVSRYLASRQRPTARLVQRYTDEHLQTATKSLGLTGDKVQAILETGEALGLFADVYEVATSKYLLNPGGFAKVLGSFKAIMPKKDQSQAPRGAPGFLREIQYGLAHIRQGLYVQYGAMAPDDLADALDTKGLKAEAAHVRKTSGAVTLGDEMGGDVVVWGGKQEKKLAGETVQHKVVEGEDDHAVANELRNAVHQLAGRHQELAIAGTQRTADIVIMPANKLATAKSEALVQIIEGRMKDTFQGQLLSAYVDVVRISATDYQVEYDVKTATLTVVNASPQKELTEKTPAKWNAEAIKPPPSAKPEPQPEPEKPAAPVKKVAEMNTAEVGTHIEQIAAKSGKPFDKLSKSDLGVAKRDLAETKKQWLATKTATQDARKAEIAAAKAKWVDDTLATKTPPAKDAGKWRGETMKALKEQWDKDHDKEVKETAALEKEVMDVETHIAQKGGEDGDLLKKFGTTLKSYEDQEQLLVSYEKAAKARSDYVKAHAKEKTDFERVAAEWDSQNPGLEPLVKKNREMAKFNEESIERDRIAREGKAEQRAKDEKQAKEVAQPLFEVVPKVLKAVPKELTDSIVTVVKQSRHAAGIGVLCQEIATKLTRALELAEAGMLDRPSLVKFTENVCKRGDYNNLQGDLAEITQAVRTAEKPAEPRGGPVVIGTTAHDLKPDGKTPQEVDVSYESPTKDVLYLEEVAWDLKTLENKLLGIDKQSQREGYARVIKDQKATGKQVRMTYVVHKTGADDTVSIGTNPAPAKDKLGADVAGEIAALELGGMGKILVKRRYYLSLGGRVYSPDDINLWIK